MAGSIPQKGGEYTANQGFINILPGGPFSRRVCSSSAMDRPCWWFRRSVGLGRLTLKTVEVFFCPSDEIRRPHRVENGWAKNTLNGTVYDSVSYWYWATPKDWTTRPANAKYFGLDKTGSFRRVLRRR